LSYIGKTPTVGNFIKLDDITTSSTNSYTLQHNSVNFSPESANHMLVSLNGVIQAPNTAFSVSGSTITFLPSSGTLSSSDSIDFIMVYGNVLDVGVATTVSDASITKAKMNLISDSSSAGLTIKGDGGSENGTLQLNCSQNSHGVKLSSPAHSSGQSYELILPTGNVTADKFLKVASVSGSGTTGVGQLSFADAGESNAPNFFVKQSSSQNIAFNTSTKLEFATELLDSDNAFASNTFTVPSGEGGKYFIFGSLAWVTSNDFDHFSLNFKVNGSGLDGGSVNSNFNQNTVTKIYCITLSAGDTVDAYAYHNHSASALNTYAERTNFGAFKLTS